jgi:hypothetical protein
MRQRTVLLLNQLKEQNCRWSPIFSRFSPLKQFVLPTLAEYVIFLLEKKLAVRVLTGCFSFLS